MLPLKMDPGYEGSVGRFLASYGKRKEKAIAEQKPRPKIEVTLELYSPKRSLAMNNLMWALYDVTVDVMNGRQIDPELNRYAIYDQDMRSVAPTVTLTVREMVIDEVEKMINVKWKEPVPGTDLVNVHAIKTSSHWNTEEMSRHLEFLFNRLAFLGVPMMQANEVSTYWLEWRHHMAENKIVLHRGEALNGFQYRNYNPSCEACGKSTIKGGHLHHIRTRGAAFVDERDDSDDWIMLCDECHVGWMGVHQRGVGTWLKDHEHLRPKFEMILGEVG